MKQFAMTFVMARLLKDPEKNLLKLVNWADRFVTQENHKQMVQSIRKFFQDKDSNWYKYAMRLLRETHPHVVNTMAVNFFVNANIFGVPKQLKTAEEIGAAVPWAILMDPTSACNLKCTGCWANDYSKADNLPYETLARIVREGRELGIYFYVLSGGEPLVRKKDIIKLGREFPDVIFLAFTNGTLVDEEFACQMRECGNISLAFSLEGFEERTDQRRGKGTFQKVMDAMDLLREKGLVYGCSTTYTSLNTEEVGSDEYIQMLIDKGVAYLWYFTYVPVGGERDFSLMATPEQRAWMAERIMEIRKKHPLFVLDFWNDGEAAKGCIAGGRRYLHINAAGEVEPCAFIHYAVDNIKDKSVREILTSPLMRAYQKRMPFNENPLRPCPLIDNPQALYDIVQESGAHPTQVNEKPGDLKQLKEDLKNYASRWGAIADKIWEKRRPKAEERAG